MKQIQIDFRRWTMRLVGAGLILVAPFFFGPGVIHACYRGVTSKEEVQRQRAEYWRLETMESKLSGVAIVENWKARYRLFLWFHARGLGIDEGHESPSPAERWRELINHWRGYDEAG